MRRKGMEKLLWLIIVIIIMFVIVALLASFFQSGANKGGKTSGDLVNTTSIQTKCATWCVNICFQEPSFGVATTQYVYPEVNQPECNTYKCNCSSAG